MKTQTHEKLTFKLPDLPYPANALEPHIDERTMQVHHGKHHATYVENLNKALEKEDEHDATLEEILQNISAYSNAVRNNAGGHYNHSMFWKILSKEGSHEPSGELADAITKHFGSFENFKTEFEKAALARFGSGWVWLIVKGKELAVTSTANQDNPLMNIEETRGFPILGLDVWEHAYYLKYQNKRADYTKAFWNILNWDEVNTRFKEAKKQKV